MPGRGTSPLSSGRIFVRRADPGSKEDANEKKKKTAGLQMQYFSCKEDEEQFSSFFKQYTQNNRSNLWFSRDLAIILNMYMPKKPSKGSCQFLLLGEDTPPIVGVVFEGKNRKVAQKHAVQLARRLTRSLTDVCTGKFVLIAVALPKTDFNCACLEKAVEQQRELMEGIYRRKLELEASEYLQLSEAVRTVQRMSPVPFFLHDSSCTLEKIAVLEEDWFHLLSSYIEELTGTKTLAVTFDQKPETKFKEQAAVLEACRRIGCHASIWIDGSEANADFLSEIEDFKAKAKKQLHQTLQLYSNRKYRKTDYTITIVPQNDANTGMTGALKERNETLTGCGKETMNASKKTQDDSSEQIGGSSSIKTSKISSEKMDATNSNKKSIHTTSDKMTKTNKKRKITKTPLDIMANSNGNSKLQKRLRQMRFQKRATKRPRRFCQKK